VFVGGLPMTLTDKMMRWFFQHWGHVEDARIIYDLDTGKSRRFGFVTYAARESAAGAYTRPSFSST